jgi:type IV pilus assembly protein PilY1
MLKASYGYYPQSSGGKISSNVTGTGLCNVNQSGSPAAGCPAASGTTDNFVSTKEYFGMFDVTRCYTYSGGSGGNFSPDTSVTKLATAACSASDKWDGNFLNWLTMRKVDVSKKVLIGGNTGNPAPCFDDGTCNAIQAANQTGDDGGTGSCNNASQLCYRFVKAAVRGGNYWPSNTSTVPNTGSSGSPANTTYFGMGEGFIWARDIATENGIFSNSAEKFNLKIDLTGESAAKKREQSIGLFQDLQQYQMRIGVMLTNSGTSGGTPDNGGTVANKGMYFDQNLVESVYTGIRNTALKINAPLAEATYEGLCYFSQENPCYNTSPSNYAPAPRASSDPFYVKSTGKMVSCCKNFILMLTSGAPSSDDTSPNTKLPTSVIPSGADPWTVTNGGVTTSRLDEVTYAGRTNDLRPGATSAGGKALDKVQNVRFYSVNMLGGSTGATLLASGSKYGGFEGTFSATGTTSCTFKGETTLPGDTNGATGTSHSSWDSNKDCVPDTYFEAQDGPDLEKQIKAAIAAILKNSTSGTSASVLASSSTGEGAVYQSFFYPSRFDGVNQAEVKWTGYTQSLFIDTFGNLRMDKGTGGVPDGRMVYEDDPIVRTKVVTDSDGNDQVCGEIYDDTSPADGKADSSTPNTGQDCVLLKDLQPLWEAGEKLWGLTPGSACASNNAGVSCRRILTWVDENHDGVVGSTESMVNFEPDNTNAGKLRPYLRGADLAAAKQTINFVRGCNGYVSGEGCTDITSLRDRRVVDGGTTNIWKLGDPVNATPTIVGAPQERYDTIYGDSTYSVFYKARKDRRQVLYVGANDGMLHAFNVGFYNRGDAVSTVFSDSKVEHGWFGNTSANPTDNPTTRNSSLARGAELWGFIPYQLLPHLAWLQDPSYPHVYYVDLKPKVTDVRIFCETTVTPAPSGSGNCVNGQSTTHHHGWGTILIGGFRLGGSCGKCDTTTGNAGAPPMTYTETFTGSTSSDRTFYSAYFILDITDPEKDPVLIGTFTSSELGLTTSYPAVFRTKDCTSPCTDKTSVTGVKWYVAFGSGAVGYLGGTSTTQASKMFVMNLASGAASTFSTGDNSAFMGDLASLDADLDYRVDAVYGGNTIEHTTAPKWTGKMFRLITNEGNDDPTTWTGPHVLLAQFTDQCRTWGASPYPTGPCYGTGGPVTAGVGMAADDGSNIWIFWGTGRYFDPVGDKSDTSMQYYFGVKDPAPRNKTATAEKNNLLDVTQSVVCPTCSTVVTGVSGVTTFDGLESKIQGTGTVAGMDGWFNRLPTNHGTTSTFAQTGERVLVTPSVLGGTVFFSSFIPSEELCTPSGTGVLNAVYYKTGSAYKSAIVGVGAGGENLRRVDLGQGLPSQVAVHLGAQGGGNNGTSGAGQGCAGRMTGIIQTSTSNLMQVCGKPALSVWSRYVSWNQQRD